MPFHATCIFCTWLQKLVQQSTAGGSNAGLLLPAGGWASAEHGNGERKLFAILGQQKLFACLPIDIRSFQSTRKTNSAAGRHQPGPMIPPRGRQAASAFLGMLSRGSLRYGDGSDFKNGLRSSEMGRRARVTQSPEPHRVPQSPTESRVP